MVLHHHKRAAQHAGQQSEDLGTHVMASPDFGASGMILAASSCTCHEMQSTICLEMQSTMCHGKMQSTINSSAGCHAAAQPLCKSFPELEGMSVSGKPTTPTVKLHQLHQIYYIYQLYQLFLLVVNQPEAACAAAAEYSRPLQDKETIQKRMPKRLYLAMMMMMMMMMMMVTQRRA